MIIALGNQSLLDIAIQEAGTVLSVFDYAIDNELSITDLLEPGQLITPVAKKEYESFMFHELVQKYIDKRDNTINIIENQSLIDVAIQEDGCVLAVFDWAIHNEMSITDLLTAGQKIKMPKSEEFRYNELANYFKSKNTLIATFNKIEGLLEYYLPGEFPYSF